MSSRKTHGQRVASPTLHAAIIFSVLAFFFLLFLACILKVEIIARGQGKLRPQGEVQEIQSEYNGRVVSIDVKKGDLIKTGDVIINLEQSIVRRELADIQAQIVRNELEEDRLLAFSSFMKTGGKMGDLETAFNRRVRQKNLAAELADVFLQPQLSLLRSEAREWQDIANQKRKQLDTIAQSQRIQDLETKRLKHLMEFELARLVAAETLHISGSISKKSVEAAKKNTAEVSTRFEIANAKQDEFQARKQEIEANFRTSMSRWTSQIDATLVANRGRLFDLRQQEAVKQRQLSHLSIVAPADGIVDTLEVTTLGAVISSGETLATLVPIDIAPTMEVFFTNVEAGFLKQGQAVNVGLDAFPAERFGLIKGKLIRISADAVKGPQDVWGFTAEVELLKHTIAVGSEQILLKAGMTGRADAITGQRTLISYFFAPIVATFQQSLGER